MKFGYILLFRKLMNSPFYQDSQYVHLWVHLLMDANHKEGRVKINGTDQFITLNPGQMLTSRKALSDKTGIQESKVNRILKALESEQQIEQQTFNKFRVITITNWSKHQHNEQQIEQQMNSKRTTDEQQMNTNKNVNKEKNNNYLDGLKYIGASGTAYSHQELFQRLWKVYPRKIGRPEAEKHYLKTVKTEKDMILIARALDRYATENEGKEQQFIKHGSAWFCQWQGWIPEETQ